MKKFLIFIFISTIMASCKGQEDKSIAAVGPTEFAAKLNDVQKPQLIDVRTPAEFSSGHLVQAQNINWKSDDFAEKVSKLNKSQPTFVYCKSGGRSGQAADKLRELGFTNVYDLEGGITKWSADGMPVDTTTTSANPSK